MQAAETTRQPQEAVTVMRLCEVTFVTPRPGQLYRFVADPACERCMELDAPYAEERRRMAASGGVATPSESPNA